MPRRTRRAAARPDVVTVYRVEHPETGKGAYAFHWAEGNPRSSHLAATRPAPRDDRDLGLALDDLDAIVAPATGRAMLGLYDGLGIFGVPNTRAYRAWFGPKDRKALADRGLRVSVYEVHASAVARSAAQVVFLPAAARRVRTLHPMSKELAACPR